MKYLTLLLLFPGLVYAQQDSNPPMEGFNADDSHPQAIEIADQVMASMGGRAAWDNARYLSWTIFGEDHVWDKWTGRFRWQGDSTVVLMNIHTMEGRAFKDGNEITPADELLAGAYRDWINAGYWLLMPYKLKDSGVTLGYKGEETMANGHEAHVLTLRFDGVGLTPDNGYDVYVNKELNLVEQWSYYADADADEQPRFTTTWEGYESYGGIMLADTRAVVNSESNVRRVSNLGVYSDLPDSVFEDPNQISLASLTETGTY
ncbi:MAG: hypothetical protein OXI05_13125 [Bacteroidota bacterium]|nr:hypothetical protein [Bacteroidota bacterium]MCY3629829.1 hypothetical protein [Bacteroidota bacterium]MDE2646761.1 hypothetical protein [Bacteroidota bacterium]